MGGVVYHYRCQEANEGFLKGVLTDEEVGRQKEGKMIAKNWFILAVVVTLLVSPLPSCQAASKPTPTPKPHPVVAVDLLGTRAGTGAHALGYALSDIILKHHPWLRIAVMDTFGGTDNLGLIEKRSPKERETTIFVVSDVEYADAIAGRPPYQKKRPIKLITPIYQRQGMLFITLDKNIKTYKDMVGKRVATLPVGHSMNNYAEDMLMSWGIMDKVKIAHMGLTDISQFLMDGSVDVGFLPCITVGNKWELYPTLKQITKPIYFISWTEEFAKKTLRLTGHKTPSIPIPAGSLGPNQLEPIHVLSTLNFWGCYPEINPEIPYEIAKIQNEKAELFASYHVLGKGVPFIREDLAKGSYTRDDFHASALKYFNEAGIKIPLD